VEKLEDAAVQNPQTKNIYETTPFYLTVEDTQTGCEAFEPDEVIVEVSGGFLTTNPSSFPDSVFCIGETFWLHANAGGGSGSYTISWTDEDGNVLSTEPSFSLTLNDAGEYYFYVKVDDGYNDVYSYVIVTIDAAPVISLGSAVQYVCVHETITLDAGNPGASYLWSNGDTNQITSLGTTGLGYDEQTISVNVMNGEGCQSDAGVTIIFDYDYCVGVEELPEGVELKVYPNPTSGKVNVYVAGVSQAVKVYARSVVGTQVGDFQYMPKEDGTIMEIIDLTDQAPGIYFLIIEGNEIYHAVKILIQ